MPVEVANILRRAARAGDISEGVAALAHTDLADLRADLFPDLPFADRVWELRRNLTACDARYVALAEGLDAELATLDVRSRAYPTSRWSRRISFSTSPFGYSNAIRPRSNRAPAAPTIAP